MQKILVITPTYNEAENIEKFIHRVLAQRTDIDILVIDDNSPDGTGIIVKKLKETNPKIFSIHRERKMGLGTAYVEGFKFAIAHGYDFIFEMDADFSHNPDEIPAFLNKMDNYDLIIGSRYRNGVRVVNWPIRRLILSYGANLYTRIISGMPIRDSTSGFKCFRRKVLESIDLDKIHSNGYAFQIEMTFKAWHKGFRVGEHPITFVDRHAGTSKMSRNIIYEAAFLVWKLKFQSLIGKLS